MKRTGLLVLLSLLAVLLLSACGDTPTNTPAPTSVVATTSAVTTTAPAANVPGVTDTEIVLGGWGPQSGPVASYGVVGRAVGAYFKKVNDDGGINGRKIRFILEDDAYNVPRTQNAVKKLVEQDNVFALVGGLGTQQNVAVTDYLIGKNVPHIAPATGASVLCCKPLKRQIFALQTNYVVEAKILTNYALDNLKMKKAAVFYQNDPFGKEGFESIEATLKERNQPAPSSVSYETADKDFSSQALRLKESGADTLLMWSTPNPTAALLKEIEKLGWKPQIMMSVTNYDPVLFDLAGTALEGAWTAGWLPDPDSDDPKVAQYREFMKKYMPGETIGAFTMVGVAQAQIMVEALKRSGRNLTRDGLIAALETFKDWNEGLPYKINYSPTNRQGQNALYIYQASGKKWLKKADAELK
jgi:branched-chain amino acid transport system substrate-binding protein